MRETLFIVFITLYAIIVLLTLASVFFGFGQLADEERGDLFRLFILEIAFAIGMIFYSLFIYKESSGSGSTDRVDDSEQGEKHKNQTFDLDDVMKGIDHLDKYLRSINFDPDLIVSFPGGGLIVADMFHVMYRPHIPVLSNIINRFEPNEGKAHLIEVKLHHEPSSNELGEQKILVVKFRQIVDSFFEPVRLLLIPVFHRLKG